jgi:HAE1 family hydrophobic/amphiphilic exporter-1
MFVDFFIHRPIFASVCALIFVIAGAICIPTLPVCEYPNIAPPQVAVSSSYIGANAATVESAVTTLLEQQINGAEGMKYMASTSGNDGSSAITVTFDLARDPDLATVDVQGRVAAIQGRLPSDVQRTGLVVNKQSSDFVMAIGISSKDNRYSTAFLSNYADMYLKDALKRVKGVGDVQVFGLRKYSMRVWLDPDRLARRSLTSGDVIAAVNEQNAQVPAGQIGQDPAPPGQTYQMSVRAVGRLLTPSQFENIVIRTNPDGSLVRIRDVGRVELGAESYSNIIRFKGREAVGLGVMRRPGANAIDISKGVRKEMERLSKRFPPGVEYDTAFDTTIAVDESIREVLITLSQAILLVILVIFLFLQEWKSVIIPAITIPVSLIGTFFFLKLFGFSINTLTLFGITLATGLVVDDAIVVIENISRFVHEKGMAPHAAASAAMKEVTGPVIAISLVLAAVFIPVAFFPGTTGQLYRQFALTIAFSVAISTFNALTLTPALSALWLRGEQTEHPMFHWFNNTLAAIRNGFRTALSVTLGHRRIALTLFALSLGLTFWLYKTLPTSFLPQEDTGWFMVLIQAPEGVSLSYTTDVLKKVEKEIGKAPEIGSCFSLAGWSFTGSNANNGMAFASLKAWQDRKGPEHSLESVINRLRGPFSQITEARVVAFNPPAIMGLGNFGGFVFELVDLSGGSIQDLANATQELCRKANQLPELAMFSVFSPFTASTPELVVEIDRERAKELNVNIADVFNTLQVYLGSQYVNDFDMNNRVYRVFVQADQQFRSNPKDIGAFYVRSQTGDMITLSNLVKVKRGVAAQTISHYNLFRNAEINGSAAPGVSSGQAMKAMENLAARVLPVGMSYEWSGISLEEIEAGGSALVLFGLGLLFVFLVLAAQYESIVDPLIILFSVPLAILGALLAQHAAHLQNDVFCQIGLVMLIALASKNAILIVEFANKLQDTGLSPAQAVTRAAEIRLRPILMTSLAFIFGICPLVFASGAGAASRHSLGTAVCGGMILSTVLSLFVVPIIYVVVASVRPRRKRPIADVSDELRIDVLSSSSESGERGAKLPR